MKLSKTLDMNPKFSDCLINGSFEKVDIEINRKYLNFALLKLNSNSFNDEKLINFLVNASIYYALPKKRIEELKKMGYLIN